MSVSLSVQQGGQNPLVNDAAVFEFFKSTSGIALLLPGIPAGFLWERFGAAINFHAGINFCLPTLGAILLESARRPTQGKPERREPT